MEDFFPDQRWTSEGEPELGVGIVTETSKGRVKIHFPATGDTRLYAAESAPLRRVIFKPGDTIKDTQQQSMTVESVREEDNLVVYKGQTREITEAELGDVTMTHGVDERLTMGDVESPDLFALRRATLLFDQKRRISPVNGFVGGRIDLIPHQLYIAHEVSMRYAPRVLLSDQVGLGKTIEACLILHRLLLSGRISRVLILVPDSLVHQWFVELLRRFNLWFHIFDEERCEAIEEGAPDGNPFLDDQLILCSTSFLAKSQKRTRQALDASWDMLAVDEAHHLRWSQKEVSAEYQVVELLSSVTKGLLLLTATPEQLGIESHFARLRLLDPDRYSDFDSFKKETHNTQEIAHLVESLSSGKNLSRTDASLVTSIFGEERINSLEKGGEAAKNNLIEDLLDQHGPGRVIFRNTRSAMSGFPKRKLHLHPIKTEEHNKRWIQRMAKEFSNDIKAVPVHEDANQFSFKDDPRIEWLMNTMTKLKSEKALLICRSKEKALALEKTLTKRSSLKISVFHEDLSIVQRDRNAAWFSEADGARLLLCSEIGSEGRNFQFAHHLILFDLPLNPELLEQRIGRLDRIGQTHDIQIHVPYLIGSPQHALTRWFHEGLNAFEENLEGANHLSQRFSDALLNICSSITSSKTQEQLETLIRETAHFQQKLKARLAMGRDRLLEMNSYRPQKASQLIKQINIADSNTDLETYLTEVFEKFSVEMEDIAERSYMLHPARTGTEAFPSIPKTGLSVTFDRKRALSREDVAFLTWDHPLVTDAIDMILSSRTGNASYGELYTKDKPAILMETLFVLETGGEQSVYIDRFLPKTLLRIVVNHTGKEVTDEYPIKAFDKKLISGDLDKLLENDTLVDSIMPMMISTATEIAESLKSVEISNGLDKMNQTLNHEIGRLVTLHKKNNHIRPEEIKTALEEQAKLEFLIKNARIRLDSILLIRKG